MPSIARARAASPQPPKLNLHLFSPAARPPSSLTDRIAYRPETKSGSHTTLRWREVDSNPRSPVEDSTFSRPPGNRRLRNRPGSQNRVLTITRAGFTVRRAGLASNAGRPIHVLDQIL